MIKKGSKIIVKKNLLCVLEVLNYKREVINYLVKKFEDGSYIVEDVFYLNGQDYAVLDGSCYIPIECCEEKK